MNIPEYAWMCLYKQDSEYALGPNYAEILNMAKFRIWQGSQYATQSYHSEYTKCALTEFWIYLAKWLDMSEKDENISEYVWIYNNRQSSEYLSCNT